MSRRTRPGGMHYLSRRPDKPGGMWYIEYRTRDGERIRKSLDTRVLKEAKERRDKIIQGEVDVRWGPSDVDISPSDLWPKYAKWLRDHKSKQSLLRSKIDWDHFLDAVKPKTMGGVRASHVEKFKDHLANERGQSNRTINDACARMRAIYNRSIAEGWYRRGNPFEKFTKREVDSKAPRYLTAEQIDTLLEKARKHSRDIHLFCAMGVYAGLRLGEAVNATWQWIDFEQGFLTVQGDTRGQFKPKSKRFRTVPLHSKLRAILELVRQPDGYILLPGKTEQGRWRIRYEPKRALNKVVEAAGVKWCTAHVLRHTFASQLVINGVSIYKVSTWLGHADVKTTMIYSHLSPRDRDIDSF